MKTLDDLQALIATAAAGHRCGSCGHVARDHCARRCLAPCGEHRCACRRYEAADTEAIEGLEDAARTALPALIRVARAARIVRSAGYEDGIVVDDEGHRIPLDIAEDELDEALAALADVKL